MKTPFLAAALTWDGTRWPVRSLPPAARKFLASGLMTAPEEAAELFQKEEISEIRICWVPQLAGGEKTLCSPFTTPGGKRILFRTAKKIQFGPILGVSYRKK